MKTPPGERSRLISEIVRARPRSETGIPLDSVERVEGVLALARSKLPDASDEDLLRLILDHLGKAEAVWWPERRDLLSLIKKAKDLTYRRQYDKARKVLADAWQAAENLDDDESRAWVRQYQGRTERDTGHLDLAMEYYDEALVFAKKTGSEALLAVIYDQIGSTFRHRGDLDQAETYHQLALTTDPESASFVQGNLAIIDQIRGDPERAKKRNEQSRAAYAEAGNQRGLATVTLSQAEDSLDAGDVIGAARRALEAFQVGRSCDHAGAVEGAGNIMHLVIGRMTGQAGALPDLRPVLELDWHADDWPLRREVVFNVFMFYVTHRRVGDAAEIAWDFVRLARMHHDPAMAASLLRRRRFRTSPLQRVQDGLESAVRSAAGKNRTAETAAHMLGLAYCHAARGETGLAQRQCDQAGELFQQIGNRDGVRKAHRLRAELGSAS